jgi:ADP-heptose:LPS heptosyltransferase
MLRLFLLSIYKLLSFFFGGKKDFCLKDISEVNIILLGKIGMGDVLMLSPLLGIIRTNCSASINIVTNHTDYFSIKNTYWLKPSGFAPAKGSLLIAPTFSFHNIRHIINCDYFIGYFFGDFLSGNVSYEKHKVDHKRKHYFSRCFPILDSLGCLYSKLNLNYPRLNTEKVNLDFSGKYIAVSPYVNWSARQYQRDSLVEIIDGILKETDLNVLLLGSTNTEELKFVDALKSNLSSSLRVHDYSGKLSIKQLLGVINDSEIFIGNDSGPLHVSFLSDCFSIGIFGAILAENRIPLNTELLSSIEIFTDPSVCDLYPCYSGHREPICERFHACTKAIPPRAILKTVLNHAA